MLTNPNLTAEEISEILKEYLSKELGEVKFKEPLTQISGGFEAYLYKFQLEGVPEIPGPLILRLFPTYYNPERAQWDTWIQNSLEEAGLPVPKVYFTCLDPSVMKGSFMIMEFMEGETIDQNNPNLPVILGRDMARLHNMDSTQVEAGLKKREIDENRYRLDGQLYWMRERAEEHTWLLEAIQWLEDNKPEEPEKLSIIHGDFHTLNLLYKDDELTAILDWPGFLMGDPAIDIGFTLVLATVTIKPYASKEEFEYIIQMFRDGYCQVKQLDDTHVPYYMALRYIRTLQEGADGQESWRQPEVVQLILKEIQDLTGLEIKPPF